MSTLQKTNKKLSESDKILLKIIKKHNSGLDNKNLLKKMKWFKSLHSLYKDLEKKNILTAEFIQTLPQEFYQLYNELLMSEANASNLKFNRQVNPTRHPTNATVNYGNYLNVLTKRNSHHVLNSKRHQKFEKPTNSYRNVSYELRNKLKSYKKSDPHYSRSNNLNFVPNNNLKFEAVTGTRNNKKNNNLKFIPNAEYRESIRGINAISNRFRNINIMTPQQNRQVLQEYKKMSRNNNFSPQEQKELQELDKLAILQDKNRK
jgi:hypothetical protein